MFTKKNTDIFYIVNQDTFPTVGYAHQSPAFVSYGWHPVTTPKYPKGIFPGGAKLQENLVSGLAYVALFYALAYISSFLFCITLDSFVAYFTGIRPSVCSLYYFRNHTTIQY